MIVVQLKGGLGNQLFQYAAGKTLAIKNKTILKVDLNKFNKDDLRKLELENFYVNLSDESPTEIELLKPTGFFLKLKNKFLPYHKKSFYKEPHFHFDKNFFKLGNNVYISGYFQSQKYFSSIENNIREDFKIKDELIGKVKNYAENLQQQNSVSIHFRRSDYKNAESSTYHGILSSDYYKLAIEVIKGKIAQPKFYIFSDDPECDFTEMPIDHATWVSGKISTTHYEDLYLMSKCRHNIIANSSFGWWGAWLNDYQRKIVIAPKKWFNEGPKETQDLLPDAWIKI